MQTDLPNLVPVRILNEHVYCQRLAYLEWVDGVFEDNADTVEGRWVHRRVDKEHGVPPTAAGPDDGTNPPRASSVTVSSESLGLIAKVDLLEPRGATVVPIEYKRGRPRSREQPLWEPELIQVCAQVLILREAGFQVDHAEVYFHETRSRHRVEITDEAVALTRTAISEVRTNAARREAPPPLIDSPKCPRCSLVGLCLPDEVTLLRGDRDSRPRRLIASDPAAQPLYLSSQGARLTKRSERLVLIDDRQEVATRRLIDVSHVSVFGNVTIGSAAVRACLGAGIPVLWFTYGGWFVGAATAISAGSIELRLRQHRAATVGAPAIAAAMVTGKIRNGRTLLRRHGGADAIRAVEQLAGIGAQAAAERDTNVLLGLEGTAARIYFEAFARLLNGPVVGAFDFTARNRRPPRDRVNALLSFAYAMLVKDATVACLAAGLDPHVGLYHRPRFGRPSMALDLVEEFRPLVGDSVVMTAINNGEVDAGDFVERAGAVALRPAGRRKFIATYERRMTTELKHPVFGYRASYRRTLEIQARLLAATLLGDIPAYRPLTTR